MTSPDYRACYHDYFVTALAETDLSAKAILAGLAAAPPPGALIRHGYIMGGGLRAVDEGASA